METITTELMANPERMRGQEGRRYYSAQAKDRILEEYRSSGLTQREYAKRSGIKYSTLVSWIQGVRMRGSEGQERTKRMDFEELRLPGASGLVEVQMPDGTKISGSDARVVAELVRELRRV